MQIADFVQARFGGAVTSIDWLIPVFEHTGIRTRRVCRPPHWYGEDHDLGDRNAAYIEAARARAAASNRPTTSASSSRITRQFHTS